MDWLEVGNRHHWEPVLACRVREPMSECPWRGRGIRKELTWSFGRTVSRLILPLSTWGFPLPSDPSQGTSDGTQPKDDPEQIARPKNQEEEFPFQEMAPFPYRFRFKYFSEILSASHGSVSAGKGIQREHWNLHHPAPPWSPVPTPSHPLQT